MAEQGAILARGRGVGVGDLVLDVSFSQSISHRAQVTDNPIEDGSTITDHVIQLPDTLTIEGLWSDTPAGATAAELNRARDLYVRLVELKERGETVEVSTRLQFYPEVVITSIDTTRDVSTGYTVPVSIGVKEVRTAERTTEIIPVNTADGNAGRKDRGRKKADQASDKAELESSILFDTFFAD